MAKLASLPPLHPEIDGFSITAGNSAGLNDGAAALTITSGEMARAAGTSAIWPSSGAGLGQRRSAAHRDGSGPDQEHPEGAGPGGSDPG